MIEKAEFNQTNFTKWFTNRLSYRIPVSEKDQEELIQECLTSSYEHSFGAEEDGLRASIQEWADDWNRDLEDPSPRKLLELQVPELLGRSEEDLLQLFVAAPQMELALKEIITIASGATSLEDAIDRILDVAEGGLPQVGGED
jgi:hypothetical protein